MLRFWTLQIRLGLILALVGVAMLLTARVAQVVMRGRHSGDRD